MKCNEIKRKLMDYIFEESDQAEREKIEAHIQQCGKCAEELQKLRTTAKTMNKWPEVDPQKNMVFVAPKEGVFSRIYQSLHNRLVESNSVRWTMRLGVAGIILGILLLRTEIQYHNGQFSLTIGGSNQTDTIDYSSDLITAFEKMQEENVYLTKQLIAESESRQKELILSGIAELSRQIDQQRLSDLRYVDENLQHIQRTNLYNFDRTNSILAGLVKVTSGGYSEK